MAMAALAALTAAAAAAAADAAAEAADTANAADAADADGWGSCDCVVPGTGGADCAIKAKPARGCCADGMAAASAIVISPGLDAVATNLPSHADTPAAADSNAVGNGLARYCAIIDVKMGSAWQH